MSIKVYGEMTEDEVKKKVVAILRTSDNEAIAKYRIRSILAYPYKLIKICLKKINFATFFFLEILSPSGNTMIFEQPC